MTADDSRHITYALLRSETALAATEALRGRHDRAAVEGLVEQVYRAASAREVLAALSALDGCDSTLVLDALDAALASPHSSVRLQAVEGLHRRKAIPPGEVLPRLLARDESWPVRRAALDALADAAEPQRWGILLAADDPHWRVRHALLRVLLSWGEAPERRREIEERLRNADCGLRNESPERLARRQGVLAYLHSRWSGDAASLPDVPNPQLNDEDPAVLARDLDRMGAAGRRAALDDMPRLLGHEDERVRAPAAETLRRHGTPAHLAEVIALLDEPRAACVVSVQALLRSLDLDRAEAVARVLRELPERSPAQRAWWIDQVGVSLDAEELPDRLGEVESQSAVVRRALARLAARRDDAESTSRLLRLLNDTDAEVRLGALRAWRQTRPGLDDTVLARRLADEEPMVRAEAVRVAFLSPHDPGLIRPLADDRAAAVRVALAECLAARPDAADLLACLQDDPHPHVRAALTPERAAALVREPGRETSWHVLAEAARRMRLPLWELEPVPPWRPPAASAAVVEAISPQWPLSVPRRPLGPERAAVSPIGISGHYGLPVEGFVRAVEADVNLLFWEPNYRTLTDFLARLSPGDRGRLRVVAGTFEADGPRVRRDVERVLRALQVERVALFLLFWVRSWRRVAPDVREALDELKRAGKVGMVGLSTHSRPLAVEAMEAGWDPVMVRHSAAHRGAEEQVFPRAAQRGTSLITFNNTCYGRLLRPLGPEAPPSAADCYRYTLAQPGVRCCFSAPATVAQLDENLAALKDPELPPERRERLLAHGAALYREETTFRRLVRSR